MNKVAESARATQLAYVANLSSDIMMRQIWATIFGWKHTEPKQSRAADPCPPKYVPKDHS